MSACTCFSLVNFEASRREGNSLASHSAKRGIFQAVHVLICAIEIHAEMSRDFFRRHHRTIEKKLESYQPHRGQRYAAAAVLLLTWKDTDLDLGDEWDSLEKMFQTTFNYHVQRYSIPTAGSQFQLGIAVNTFLMQYGKPDHLIIVYYGGHGGPTKDGSTECEWWA